MHNRISEVGFDSGGMELGKEDAGEDEDEDEEDDGTEMDEPG